MTKKNNIKVIKFAKNLNRDNEFVLPEYGTAKVSTKFIKEYTGVINSLVRLSSSAAIFLKYLITTMNEYNIVSTSAHVREEFGLLLKSEGVVVHSKSTISRSIKELVDKKFLFKKMNGVYLINPEYYDNSTEDSRIRKIQVLLEFEAGMRSSISIEHIYESFNG